MSYVIIVSALALAVALGAVVAHMRLAIRFQKLSHNCSQLLAKITAVDKSLRQSERTAVVAEVAGLEGVVHKLAKSMRSQFGTIHAKLAQLETVSGPEPASNGERPTRDELRKQHLRPPLPPTAE